MTKSISLFSSPFARFVGYLATFAAGAALYQSIRSMFPYGFTLHALLLITSFVLIGALILHSHALLSRITSGSTLLAMSGIAIGFDGTIPASYLLPFVLAIAYLGAQPFLHESRNPSKVALFGAFSIGVALFLFMAVLYINAAMLRSMTAN